MAAVLGLVSPGAPSSPALASKFVAVAYSYLSGLVSPGVGGTTSVWVYDGSKWVPASGITVITGA